MLIEYQLIDAKDKILGRFCSQIAKRALLGEYIVIINAKDAIISGTKRDIHEKYLAKLNISTATNPRRGPFHERRPDTFMRRVIKQMLPRKKLRGKEALKRVHVYITDIPERFKSRYQKLVPTEINNADKKRLSYYNKFITLDNLCQRIGWKKTEIEA
ncbi:MAG: 50S ribosomal protein L13 [Candidatus Lokiarchaeota archaeon]|nr:50S ribosomal protein L13 [Candidatus Lokiarchaeota archaeon]MCK4479575.1 50S ribosomal protein L13 [Candidatus Lokiarchaeota archaeon]MCK4778632.1 50S ribosomal protein L13 [Candidatus Lokiarchaeota archaeon]